MAAYSSQTITFGRAWLETVVAAWKTTASNPLINTAKLRLTTVSSFLPSPDATIAGLDANEANYSGYTAGGLAIVLSAPVNLSPTCVGSVVNETFIATAGSPFVPNVLTGYWADDGTNVIAMEAFGGAGIPINGPGDFLALLMQLPLQALQRSQ